MILDLFRKFEDFIESRKPFDQTSIVMNKIYQSRTHLGAYNSISRHIYNESIGKIEQMYRIFKIFVVDMSFFGVMVPPLLNTAINYFVYDLKDESFLMPRPMWCVEIHFKFESIHRS